MFYTFNQNNSGGRFAYVPDQGISHHVIIEAKNIADANYRAESIGLYFNGCDAEIDCPCCGDRWSPAWRDGDEQPSIYGKPLQQYIAESLHNAIIGKWIDGYEIFVHYADHRVKGFWFSEGKVKKARSRVTARK